MPCIEPLYLSDPKTYQNVKSDADPNQKAMDLNSDIFCWKSTGNYQVDNFSLFQLNKYTPSTVKFRRCGSASLRSGSTPWVVDPHPFVVDPHPYVVDPYPYVLDLHPYVADHTEPRHNYSSKAAPLLFLRYSTVSCNQERPQFTDRIFLNTCRSVFQK